MGAALFAVAMTIGQVLVQTANSNEKIKKLVNMVVSEAEGETSGYGNYLPTIFFSLSFT